MFSRTLSSLQKQTLFNKTGLHQDKLKHNSVVQQRGERHGIFLTGKKYRRHCQARKDLKDSREGLKVMIYSIRNNICSHEELRSTDEQNWKRKYTRNILLISSLRETIYKTEDNVISDGFPGKIRQPSFYKFIRCDSERKQKKLKGLEVVILCNSNFHVRYYESK